MWLKILLGIILFAVITYFTVFAVVSIRHRIYWEAEREAYSEIFYYYIPLESELKNKLDPDDKFIDYQIKAFSMGTTNTTQRLAIEFTVLTEEDLIQAKENCSEYIPPYIEMLQELMRSEESNTKEEKPLIKNLLSQLSEGEKQLLKKEWKESYINDIYFTIKITQKAITDSGYYMEVAKYSIDNIEDLKESEWYIEEIIS